jgi:hypothetical protein
MISKKNGLLVAAFVALLGLGCSSRSGDSAQTGTGAMSGTDQGPAKAPAASAPAKTPAASSSKSTTETGKTEKTAGLTDDQLKTELATPPAKPTLADLQKLVADTVNPVATTARLKLLNDFIAVGIKDVDPTNSDEPYAGLAFAMEGIFWATPRDLTPSVEGYGGQTFATTIDLAENGVGPTKLTVSGTASAAYSLDLTIAGAHVTVNVPAGADANATAKAIGDAIDAANDDIMKTIGDETSFDVIGGSHADSLSGVDDIEVSTEGATVSILVALNG